jgi:NAD(P)-dependent dehydrogenase (short-subunit alcohol dehydrogenase family)
MNASPAAKNEKFSAQGKLALVTGSGLGIGRTVALEFARTGADVALHYLHGEEGARSTVAEIQKLGRRAAAFKADLSEVAAAKEMTAQAIEFLGGIDILINNAGITMNLPFEQVQPEQFDRLYHVNVRAQFFITQAALPYMLTRGGGAVINISSIHAFQGLPEHSVYAGTKGAVVAHTRELAIELAPKGIRVNGIAPGAIEVENYFHAILDYDALAFGRCIPAGFVGLPLDVANAALFLASDEARYMIGQTLILDGGTTSWMPFSDSFRKSNSARFGRGYVPGL